MNHDALRRYLAHQEALLEVLDDLSVVAASPRAADRAERASLDRRRRELLQQTWKRLLQLDRYELAASWVRRTRQSGLLAEAVMDAALRRIDDRRELLGRQGVARARALMLEAVGTAPVGASWFRLAVNELLRFNTPALVRYLMRPEHLESSTSWQRWLAITVLGRLGDTKTCDKPGGRDAVELLCALLKKTDPMKDRDTALWLIEALGLLRDGRAKLPVFEVRRRAGSTSAFKFQTTPAFRSIPEPTGISRLKLLAYRAQMLLGDSQPAKALAICNELL